MDQWRQHEILWIFMLVTSQVDSAIWAGCEDEAMPEFRKTWSEYATLSCTYNAARSTCTICSFIRVLDVYISGTVSNSLKCFHMFSWKAQFWFTHEKPESGFALPRNPRGKAAAKLGEECRRPLVTKIFKQAADKAPARNTCKKQQGLRTSVLYKPLSE